jgi:hypothetical protein
LQSIKPPLPLVLCSKHMNPRINRGTADCHSPPGNQARARCDRLGTRHPGTGREVHTARSKVAPQEGAPQTERKRGPPCIHRVP